MAERGSFYQWGRMARRSLRAYVQEHGQVPALAAAVSKGSNPRRVQWLPALHLMPDGLAVREQIAAHAKRYRAAYIAQAARVDLGEGELWMLLVCLGPDGEMERWQAPVSDTGLGAWEAGEFRPGDVEFLRRALAQAA